MEELYKCSCGCDHFIAMIPHQYRKRDVEGWSNGLPSAAAGIGSILICVVCQKMILPNISFAGKSIMDPNVKAYGSLMDLVKKYNAELEKHNTSHMPLCPSVWTLSNTAGETPVMYVTTGTTELSQEGTEMGIKKLDTTKTETFGSPKVKSQEPKKTKPKTTRAKKPKVDKAKGRTAKETTDQ